MTGELLRSLMHMLLHKGFITKDEWKQIVKSARQEIINKKANP